MPPKSIRLSFIDFARTYAVFLALLAHVLLMTGFFKELGEQGLYIKQFTRMATPMFVFMFGFMVEFVYVDKAKKLGFSSIARRLTIRSLQCFLAFALTAFSAVIAGHESIADFVRSLALFGDSTLGNILRTYAILLLAVVPLLIRIRLSLGSGFILIALVLVLMSFPWLLEYKSHSYGVFDHPMNVLFGVGRVKGGPSVWHSTSFLLAGMYVASSLRGKGNQLLHFYISSLTLLVVMVLIGGLLIDDTISVAWWKFADYSYRASNMIGYYIIGIVCSVASILLFSLLFGTRPMPAPITLVLPLGYSSLFSYTFGNILLNLTGGYARYVPLPVYIALFFLIVWFMTARRERVASWMKNKCIVPLG